MRWSLFAAVVLTTGCVHLSPSTTTASVIANPDPIYCSSDGTDVPVRLTVRNEGPGKLSLGTNGENGPPYSLNWAYYRVLSTRNGQEAVDYEHGPGGHGSLSTAKVTLGPGESTEFAAKAYELTPESAEFTYRIEVQDLAGVSFASQPFGLCDPGSTPNNSFKPTPLHRHRECP